MTTLKNKLLAYAIVIAGMLFGSAIEAWRDDKEARLGLLALAAIVVGMIALVLLLGVHFANARDLGQWENTDPKIHEWYKNLMRPDAPSASCCTEADAYWADEIHVRDGKTYAVITDDRPDQPLGRPHIANGTEFEVPPEKLKWDSSNPTGHNILFVSVSGYTWCFVQGSGT